MAYTHFQNQEDGWKKGDSHKSYYEGTNLGNYQFTTIHDIVDNFMISYVGENKIIPTVKRLDVAFHAHRALQELSFDTLKSFKSQQIELPPTLVMPLPHDYVNYTKISSVDSAGIKHALYPTKHTSNPFQILQDSDGSYEFPADVDLVENGDYSQIVTAGWTRVANGTALPSDAGANTTGPGRFQGTVDVEDDKLTWSYVTKNGQGAYNWSQICFVYQKINVSDQDYINLSADGVTETFTYTSLASIAGTATSTIRVGITTTQPQDSDVNNVIGSTTGYPTNPNAGTNIFDLQSDIVGSPGDNNYSTGSSYIEWTGDETASKELNYIDVRGLNEVFVVALSFIDTTTHLGHGMALKGNSVDNISVKTSTASVNLQSPLANRKESSTWNNYKSHTPSENNISDYQDYQNDIYWPNRGRRYGLDPQHAQVNGSFYIDERIGRIHFSSNISGKTVILDYISDSLGTDKETMVHKFAEEAMYKSIAHAIISTSSFGQQLVPRFKKEKFAAVRQAKLRLSNIKLEEFTQILRGKSKQIKH
jgi:hypothetical protein|tara:strand:+ start:812 stop:2416 length:1605 start_codon:yes stop_codon:yes gene_type:complete